MLVSLLRLFLGVQSAWALEARTWVINTGVRIPLTQAISNVTAFAAGTALGVCSLFFLLGAAQWVISAGDQTKVDNGKKMMINSLIGLAIVLGSYGIIRTVIFFLYSGPQ